MTRGALLSSGVTKEIRALFPAWIACTLAVCAGAVIRDGKVLAAGVLAYGLGSIALGAQSIGHEYTHRTLELLLSQPSDRRRLFLMKLGVLTSMLLTLSALAWTVLFKDGASDGASRWHQPLIVLLPALCGLFVAPWLTMLCRSPLAGVVFTIVVPGSMLTLGQVFGFAKYGDGPDAEDVGLAILSHGTIALCAVAAVLSWRMFMRLEAIEGPGPDVRMPQWFRGSGRVRPRHPVWLLAKKELHLQQMTLVLVGCYIVGWATWLLVKHLIPESRGFLLATMITMMYLTLQSILIGSLASAEERQFGTLEWHLLLPMAAWQQWAVKAGMALGVAILLGIGLPAVLWHISPSGDGVTVASTVVVVLLTTSSLYVSTLCASGVWAMALWLPVAYAAVLFIQGVSWAVWWTFSHLFGDSVAAELPRAFLAGQIWSFRSVSDALWLATAAGLVALLLWFASLNHRSAERSTTRVWLQGVWIAGFLTFGVLLRAVVFVLYQAG